jgi:hypothetical protein
MNRRSFLSLSGLISGSILIPASLASRIRETCIGNRQPLLIPPPVAGRILYAVKGWGGEYTLKLGSLEGPSPPTLGEYLEDKGWDLHSEGSIRTYLREYKGYSDDEIRERLEAGETLDDIVGDLDAPLDGYDLDDWDDKVLASESPEALAFHYLEELPLADESGHEGHQLGELNFTEGDRPGSNLTYVEAADLATLACLQHRLNDLNEDIAIEIR